MGSGDVVSESAVAYLATDTGLPMMLTMVSYSFAGLRLLFGG